MLLSRTTLIALSSYNKEMKTLLLILLFPIFGNATTDSSKIVIYNEAYILTSEFIKDSYINAANDSIVFALTEDSVLVADHVWTSDSSKIWIYYQDRAFNDFWETYSRAKYNQGWVGRQDHKENPKRFINEYFNDKRIELHEILIYRSAIKRRIFNLCGGCYGGTDFLFQINKSEYAKLCEETRMELKVLKSSYH